jgi:ribosomal protein S6--L-glutamate ligase
MEVIDYRKCSMVIEQGRAEMYYKDFPLSQLDAVIPRITSSFTQMGAIVLSHLKLMKVFSTVKPDALLMARDKLRCLLLRLKSPSFTNRAFDNLKRNK